MGTRPCKRIAPMNLKEAIERGKLKQFAKEHENKDPHPEGKERMDALFEAMTKGSLPKHPSASTGGRKTASGQTSASAPSVGSSGTRTRRGT